MTTDAAPRARLRPGAAALLASGAVVEAAVRLRLAPVTARSSPGTLGVCALSALSALPLILPSAATAATVILAVSLLSLVAFHSLTVSGLIAATLAGYRAGRGGPPLLVLALCLPFLIAVLVGPRPASSESAALTLLTAALVPAATLVGASGRLRAQDEEGSAHRQDFEEKLLEHTKRGERARIARELHDIVAHHISMVSVQAETARLTTPGLPEAGARRFQAIGDTARAALTEMRRLLGVLKDDEWPDAETPPLRPQPGLSHVTELVDEAREASGSATRLLLSGRPAALDPGVELAAYRIIQEALTNARRHAPGAAVDVELCYGETEVRIRVRDNGPGVVSAQVDAAAAGHGLAGMRERAAAVGGALTAGAVAGGGFSVEAALPAKPQETA
ncbi:sensor histidine kinase [Actinospica robiniae]|uniref:sensor histidine kinase n=1 Tax=Actinospica robiniae TaxID=304901 RepID=UPI0006864984|nr:sensor histidine kinase [Actinospica robiniae]